MVAVQSSEVGIVKIEKICVDPNRSSKNHATFVVIVFIMQKVKSQISQFCIFLSVCLRYAITYRTQVCEILYGNRLHSKKTILFQKFFIGLCYKLQTWPQCSTLTLHMLL
jgi:hypothetical protein